MEINLENLHSRMQVGSFGLGRCTALFLTTIIVLPILVVIASVLQPYSETWSHLFDTVLLHYIFNSFALMSGVGIGTLLIGVSAAWLVAICDFPGRKSLTWLLLLPMAMPAYIIAYTYTGLLDVSGPIQSEFREIFNWSYGDYYFPQIRSLGGAICMLSLVLYPYVYLLARVAFSDQSGAILEASKNLGRGTIYTFFAVSLPIARPAIFAGVCLALMETLADYGTVAYFGVSAFTTGIFRIWYGLGELTTAAQLSAFLLLFVFTFILIERESRRRLRFYKNENRAKPEPTRLSGWKAYIASLYCWLIVTLGFILPALQLAVWAKSRLQENLNYAFLELLWNSVFLSTMAASCCVCVALFLSIIKRLSQSGLEFSEVEIAKLGYAVPGAVIAVGVLISAGWLDDQINMQSQYWLDQPVGLIFSGTLSLLVFAYVARFLSVSLQTVESGLTSIKPNIDESGFSLGSSPFRVFKRLHLPLLRPSLLTAFLLVFVDVLKELPTTLILRPFNYNTLAVRTYEMASDERLIDAALPALTIVVIGLFPILFIFRYTSKEYFRYE